MYYVYILCSRKLGRKYIGRTVNLKERIRKHLNGQTPYTSITKDWKLIYYEAFLSKADSIKEELFLKTGRGRERLKYLLKSTLEII